MYVLSWNHTRTGKPMTVTCSSWGAAWIRIAMIRQIFPNHPFRLNGDFV